MLRKIPFHTLFFAIFPLLSLYVTNANLIRFQSILGTLAAVVIGGTLLWGLLYALVREPAKASAIASIFLFLFFSFRSLLLGLQALAGLIASPGLVRPYFETQAWMIFWLALCLMLWASLSWKVLKGRWETSGVTLVLNVVAIGLLATVGLTWARVSITALAGAAQPVDQFSDQWIDQVSAEEPVLQATGDRLPTIYYIIVDGYARSDVLQKIYQEDNSAFVSFLENKGFYVATKATSNYKVTQESLSSSLNYMYLDEVAQQVGVNSTDQTPFYPLLDYNRVFDQLKQLGYKIVTFATGFSYTELPTADLTLSPGASPDDFQNILIGNTPLSVFLLGQQYQWHREKILYTLDHLPDTTQIEGPTFVFAHIVAPHPPFVLGRNGEAISPPWAYTINDASDFLAVGSREEYIDGYRDQLAYITGRLETVITDILESSPEPPVILLQADHGPGLGLNHNDLSQSDVWERMSILSAYYLPGVDTDQWLYASISPVNSFRVVFDAYFDAGLPLLDDRSYFSPLTNQFQFTDVTEQEKVSDP